MLVIIEIHLKDGARLFISLIVLDINFRLQNKTMKDEDINNGYHKLGYDVHHPSSPARGHVPSDNQFRAYHR